MPPELLDIFLTSVRDGFVQVSAFVAITVFAFSYIQYRTGGRIVRRLESSERVQPLFGAAMGLTPGCGGAIVVMPLYVRGTVSFGTVVATLIATAGDSAFVILVLAPKAALVSYSLAFAAALAFGYAIDRYGMGVERIDEAVNKLGRTATDGGVDRASSVMSNQAHDYDDHCAHNGGKHNAVITPISHTIHVAWWVAATAGLALGVTYLIAGAPEVSLTLGPSFAGAFTVVGLTGTTLSFYLYFVGRRYLGDGHVGRARESFADTYETLVHAAMETSFVTVWVIAAYLLYEYGILFLQVDVGAVAAAAGLFAPIAGAVIGLIPGCGPQIVLATAYSQGGIPFSALTANAISQDGDALFPLIAIDKKAAVVASIYTTIPAIIVGVALHVLFGPMFGYGVLG